MAKGINRPGSRPAETGYWRWLILATLVSLGLLASMSLARGAANALGIAGEAGSIDLAHYWLSVQALAAGENPYDSLATKSGDYGGSEEILQIVRRIQSVPANAPLQLILFSPLAPLVWPTWRIIMLVVNLLAAVSIPLLLSRLLPQRLPGVPLALLALYFWAMLPTRNVIANGQTSLIALAAVLLAAWAAPNKPWLAGLSLAIALTKYSLTLPILIWFLFFGAWIPILVAVLIHALALVWVALISGSGLQSIFGSYLVTLQTSQGFQGELDIFGLANWLGLKRPVPEIVYALTLVVGAAALLLFLRRHRNTFGSLDNIRSTASYQLFYFLLLAALPFTYHRSHDGVLMIALPALILVGRPDSEKEHFLPFSSWWVVLPLMLIFLLPRFTLAQYWAPWENVVVVGQGLAVLVAWWLVSLQTLLEPVKSG